MSKYLKAVYLSIMCIVILCPKYNVKASENVITYAFAEWKPIVYFSDGKLRGLYVDILNEIFVKELGMELAYNHKPWKRAQKEVEEGKADILITIPTEDRQKYAIISKLPVFPFYFGIYSYSGHPKQFEINQINSVQDIIDLNLIAVTNLGNGWHKENIEKKGVQTHIANQDASIAKILSLRRADIMIEPSVTMNQVIRESKLTDKIVLTEAQLGPINMHVLLSKKSKHAHRISDINTAINKITKNGKLNSLIQKYTVLQ